MYGVWCGEWRGKTLVLSCTENKVVKSGTKNDKPLTPTKRLSENQ